MGISDPVPSYPEHRRPEDPHGAASFTAIEETETQPPQHWRHQPPPSIPPGFPGPVPPVSAASALPPPHDAQSPTVPLPPAGPDVRKGTIEKIFATFGFIYGCDGQRYFFHFGTCVSKPELLKAGDEVEYILGMDKKSERLHAQRVFRKPDPNTPGSDQRRIPNPAAAPPPRPTALWNRESSPFNQWRRNDLCGDSEMSGRFIRRPAAATPPTTHCTADVVAAVVAQLTLQQQTKRSLDAIVACVFPNGSAVVEVADHSSILHVNPSLTDTSFTVGQELRLTVQNESEVVSVAKLRQGALTVGNVRGAERLSGRVVVPIDITNQRFSGFVETVRSPHDLRETRRYAFSLLSLHEPQYLAKFVLGSSVTFCVQAEGSERRAMGVMLTTGSLDLSTSAGASPSTRSLSQSTTPPGPIQRPGRATGGASDGSTDGSPSSSLGDVTSPRSFSPPSATAPPSTPIVSDQAVHHFNARFLPNGTSQEPVL